MSATAVAIDNAGSLYIADSAGYRIRKVSNGVISTAAGNGQFGFAGDDGPATNSRMITPFFVAFDSAGNLFISDYGNGRIRKVSNAIITTVAGNGLSSFGGGDNGPATTARIGPAGVASDGSGAIYITDTVSSTVRKISNGVITTVAGTGTGGFRGDNGPAASAALDRPQGVAVDKSGNVWIADTYNNRVRKVSSGVITTIAGGGTAGLGDNGPATSAALNKPNAVAVDALQNVYIAELGANRIRKVSNGVITTVAGNGTSGFSGDGGPAISASIYGPTDIAFDAAGDLYVLDQGNSRVRKVSSGLITTVAGNGATDPITHRPRFSGDNGPAIGASLAFPTSLAVDDSGSIYIADHDNSRVRKVSKGVITTIAGNGQQGFSGDNGSAAKASFNDLGGMAVDPQGNIYVADSGNLRVRVLTPDVTPLISPNGVVPVGSTISTIQPGSWISIYGSNLATGTSVWNGDFPTSLGGVSVTIHGKPAYLWFVSPTQINLQAPDDTSTGPVEVVVTTPVGRVSATFQLAPFAPSFSLLDGRYAAGGDPGRRRHL